MRLIVGAIIGIVVILMCIFFFAWMLILLALIALCTVLTQIGGIPITVTANDEVVGHIIRFKYVPIDVDL